jgi:hypothetical protein
VYFTIKLYSFFLGKVGIMSGFGTMKPSDRVWTETSCLNLMLTVDKSLVIGEARCLSASITVSLYLPLIGLMVFGSPMSMKQLNFPESSLQIPVAAS